MSRKRFTFATFVRQLFTNKPARFHSYLMDIPKEQIAIGKGFSAHIPVINCIFQVKESIKN